MSNPTLIIPLTKKQARAAKITRPVTHPFPFNAATAASIFSPVIRDMEAHGTPWAVVIEKKTTHQQLAALWRGNPPKLARTSHQLRRESYAHVVS